MMTLEKTVTAARAAKPDKNVMRMEWQGRTCWLKHDIGETRPMLASRILRVISCMAGQPVLKPAHISSLTEQPKRIEAWRTANLPAPAVTGTGADWFVTEDAGPILHDVFKTADAVTVAAWLRKSLDTLLDAHAKNICHGRPMCKDLTAGNDGRVYFLDFEEDSVAATGFHDAAARDLLIFLGDAAGRTDADTLQKLVTRAKSAAKPETLAAMERAARFFRKIATVAGFLRIPLGREIENMKKLAQLI